MAIADTGVPTQNPHTVIAELITDNVASPDGVWVPVVNATWLEYKKQKTYQICLSPLYSDSDQFTLTGGNSTTEPRIASAYYLITIYAPSRDNLWLLYRKLMLVLNNETLTVPQSGGTYAGVEGSDYHFVRVQRSEQTKTVTLKDPACGPQEPKNATCNGYMAQVTVQIRWNE
jgi:hypothetical protein